MIPLSTRPVRFTPKWRSGEPTPPVFFIRPGSVVERAELDAELAGEHRARRVWDAELAAAAIEGIASLLAGDDGHGELIALVQAELAGDPVSDQDAQRLAQVREILAAHWPAYRALLAETARRQELVPVLAFRRFVVGWEGYEPVFATAPDGLVDLAAMAALPPFELRAAGQRAYALLWGMADAGNSDAPSQSDDGRRTSQADAPSKAAGGSSPGKRKLKTPA